MLDIGYLTADGQPNQFSRCASLHTQLGKPTLIQIS